MKPYPFASLNHLTVPCAIRLFPLSLGRNDRPRDDPGHHGPGSLEILRSSSTRSEGNKKAPSRTYVPAARPPLARSLSHVRIKRRCNLAEKLRKSGCRLATVETGVKTVVPANGPATGCEARECRAGTARSRPSPGPGRQDDPTPY